MSKRLTDLHRQRALIQEHLAWLDREIASEQGMTPPKNETAPAPELSLPSAPASPTPQVAPADVDRIISEYQQNPASLQQDARRGCLIAFWVLLGGTLLLAGIVYVLYARHIGRWW